MEAIITGDIVSSRSIEPAHRQKLFKELAVFLKTLKKNYIAVMKPSEVIVCNAKSILRVTDNNLSNYVYQ
jgi:hypothetical protein